MANSLNRDIAEGEIIVLRADRFCGGHSSAEDRAVRVIGGFGHLNHTAGRALFVMFLSDDEKVRADGYDIDKKETDDWQKEHGNGLTVGETGT